MSVRNLLVRKHGVAARTPIDGSFLSVSESVLVKFKEKPLRPFVIVGHTGFDFCRPIEHRAHFFELTFHRRDIFKRRFLWVNARFDCVVFGGKTERVESHRLENFVAFHFFVSREAVRKSVVIPMSEMQFGSGRVRKHFETVIFLVDVFLIEIIKLFFFPFLLPFCFNGFHIHKKAPPLRCSESI